MEHLSRPSHASRVVRVNSPVSQSNREKILGLIASCTNSKGNLCNSVFIGNFPTILHRSVRMASLTEEPNINNTLLVSIFEIFCTGREYLASK